MAIMDEVTTAVRETRKHKYNALVAIRKSGHNSIEEFRELLASMKENFADLAETDAEGLFHIELNIDGIDNEITDYQTKIDKLIDERAIPSTMEMDKDE